MKKALALVLAAAMVLSMAMVSFAADPDTKDREVKYTVAQTDYEWSIPADTTLTSKELATKSEAKIVAKDSEKGILIPTGATLVITASSGNGWNLINNDSTIKYYMATASQAEEKAITSGATIVEFIGGTSPKGGVTQSVYIGTTTNNVKNATAAGEHKDTVTFTLTATGIN